MQREITQRGPLLDKEGHLCETGYAKTLIKTYDRAGIKAPGFKIKEWDYYAIVNDRFALALTIADNSYMGLDSVSLLDFETGFQQTSSPMAAFTFGKKNIPSASLEGVTESVGKGYNLRFENKDGKIYLSCHMDNFIDGKPIDANVVLSAVPKESMVIVTPFANAPGAFYYNQKINCMRAEGKAEFDGKTYEFKPEDSFAVLDWGRGVWTYSNTWYWGSASGLVEGADFGFNIGYGFGDTSAASENMLFYKGEAHKLSKVSFNIPMKDGKEDYLSPWTFTSDDGRFEMNFVPVMDRASCTNALIIKSDQHQVFGRFSGKAVLDDGTSLEVKNLMGFAEKVMNRW